MVPAAAERPVRNCSIVAPSTTGAGVPSAAQGPPILIGSDLGGY